MTVNRFISSLSLSYDILPSLTVNTTWSYDRLDMQQRRYATTNSTDGALVNGRAIASTDIVLRRTGQATLNYIKDIGDNSFNAIVGLSLNEQSINFTQAQGTHFPSNKFRRIESAAVLSATSSGRITGLVSFLVVWNTIIKVNIWLQ